MAHRSRLSALLLFWLGCLVAASLPGCGDGDAPVRQLAADERPRLDLTTAGTVRVAAAPGPGFHHAYDLHWPAGLDTCTAPTSAQGVG